MRRRWIIRLLLIALIGGVAALYFALRPTPLALDQWVDTIPDSWRADWWNAEVLRETASEPMNGAYVSLDRGYRYTVPVPYPTIWMYGNSILWGSFIPDAATIPSQLQRLVGTRYRVFNRAVKGLNIAGEFLILQDTPIRAGDIVVFYDGYMDGYGDGADFQRYSALARAYTQEHGATFYHFLDPLFAAPLSQNERTLRSSYLAVHPYFVLPTAWSRLTPYADVDLAPALDAYRAAGGWAFIDFIHTTPGANALLAKAIYTTLFPAL